MERYTPNWLQWLSQKDGNGEQGEGRDYKLFLYTSSNCLATTSICITLGKTNEENKNNNKLMRAEKACW